MHDHNTTSTMIWTAALLAGSLLEGCTTDDASGSTTNGGSNGSGATSSTAGSGGQTTPGNGGASSGVSSCQTKAVVAGATIANFDSCTVGLTGDSAVSGCTVSAIGGTTLFGGVFYYSDGTGNPVFSVVDGHAGSALGLTSTQPATDYGGGFGLWTSGCFNASGYKGISFWTRGIAPNAGNGVIKLQLSDTNPTAPTDGSKPGTCTGQCAHPQFSYQVTNSWTQVHAIWSGFTGGLANGAPVTVTGDDIVQFQWEVGLAWVPNDAGTYAASPAPYELQIDEVAFE